MTPSFNKNVPSHHKFLGNAILNGKLHDFYTSGQGKEAVLIARDGDACWDVMSVKVETVESMDGIDHLWRYAMSLYNNAR